ncbi:Ig-like domain-containing protein [Listeria booriae]|uniref:Ig-like domain-containing protein n=1 Tax=Listeria booriae TaxID=1552123 RepID=UPI002880A44B|nr:Ig-like domain-containing protein [Listeria booriae]MDT0112076.1 Ig-like domain-containing protein [Listeria booriae]
MSKNQTMKKVAMAVVAANVVASSLITAMPAKSMAAENQGTEAGNKAEQKLTSGLKSSQNLLQNPEFNGMTGWVKNSSNFTATPNGDGSVTMSANTTQLDPAPQLKQVVNAIPGHTYRLTVTATNVSNAKFDIGVGPLLYGNWGNVTGTRTETCEYTATGNTVGVVLDMLPIQNSLGTFKFSNISLEDITVLEQTTLSALSTTSTTVAGKGQPNGTVVIKNGETQVGTGTVDASGNYNIAIPRQAYGSTLTATVTSGTLTSSASQTVQQAPIATPTINPLTSKSTTASGTGEAGSTLTFKANGIEYLATVTSNGTWSVTIPKQAANTSVEAASVLNGVSSAKATASISYEGPSTPTLDNVNNTSTRVTGTGDSGNIITIKVKTGDSAISYSGTIDDAGKFSIDIDTPDAGAIVEAVAQDNTGTDSQNITTTVLDVIAPDAPKVNAVKSTDTIISGTGEANCDVTVKLPSGGIIQGRINSQGAFSITIPKQAVGAKIEVSLTDAAGNKSDATTVTVQADTLAAPTINDYYATAGYVTGSAPVGASKIALYIDNQLVRYGAIDSNGKYQIYAADNAKMNTAGTAFQVVAIDANGSMSTKANATVQAKIAAPSIQDYYTTDAYAKGVATGASKVTLYVNGKAVRTAAVNADGNYSVYTGDQASLTTAGTNFQISATNAAGMESAKTAGTVKSKLTAPVINKYAATDAYARGTAAAGSKQVVLYVDGKAVRTAAVNADGTYAIYTGDQVALTVAGNTFQIASKDAVGNESPKATGTVVSVLAAPTIATYYTTDVYAKGTTPAGATKVALYVDGKFVRYATVTDGKFSIYTGDQAKLATAGSTFQLASVDAKGTIGNMATATVQADNRVAYQLTATGYDMAKDQNVSGTAGSSITRVKIFVNGDVKRQTSVANGAYAVYAKDVITSVSDTVEIAGYDAQGFERSRVTVSVTSVAPTKKVITPADYTIGTDSITGTIDSDIKKVQLFVNDVLARQAAISGNSFTVYAADKVTSASQKVEMVGFDASGAEIARQAVNVK